MDSHTVVTELMKVAEELLDLKGTKKHHLTEKEAESDALKLSKKWGKPYYVYYSQAAGTWDYGSEKPNPKWSKKTRQVMAHTGGKQARELTAVRLTALQQRAAQQAGEKLADGLIRQALRKGFDYEADTRLNPDQLSITEDMQREIMGSAVLAINRRKKQI